MDYSNLVVFIIMGIVIGGFIYYNFIFQRKHNKEEENKK
ncbi:hypothetical protein SDC9_182317 [bioreactor metagenome]|uniref:Uncharacterized protein n=1 Tax=bioreactor metagenome TaxID=1076179 RepID=A0A645HGL9_9ZZZZ